MARVLIERDSRRPCPLFEAVCWMATALPVQTVQLGPGGGLIGLDHGHVVRLLGLGQPGDIGLHGVQRVEGDHVSVQVERCKQGPEVPRLVGLGPHFGLGEGDRAVRNLST